MSATTTSHARRTAERERVEEACRALLSSDGWRRWVRARSAFHSYSLNNQLLIVLQSPNATRVAGFHTWRKLGRQVRKGEKSIRILAPLLIREVDANANGRTIVDVVRVSVIPNASASTPSRTPARLPADMALGGSGHADTINSYPTGTTCFTDLRDHAVRLMKRRDRHGLHRCCQGQGKSNSDQSDHSFLQFQQGEPSRIACAITAFLCPLIARK